MTEVTAGAARHRSMRAITAARPAAKPPRKSTAKRRTLRAEDLLARLEEAIIDGSFAPGMRLDERILAERFKVSRTPVREALWHLAASGLVEMRPRRGAVVKELSITELIEMFQMLAELEGLCARLAARRMTAEERARLRDAHRACEERLAACDQEGFFAANNEFHEIVFVGSHNAFVQQESRRLRNRVNPYRRYITHQPGRMTKSVAEHAAVVGAIEAGDGEAAHHLMRIHLNVLGEGAADLIASFSVLPLKRNLG